MQKKYICARQKARRYFLEARKREKRRKTGRETDYDMSNGFFMEKWFDQCNSSLTMYFRTLR